MEDPPQKKSVCGASSTKRTPYINPPQKEYFPSLLTPPTAVRRHLGKGKRRQRGIKLWSILHERNQCAEAPPQNESVQRSPTKGIFPLPPPPSYCCGPGERERERERERHQIVEDPPQKINAWRLLHKKEINAEILHKRNRSPPSSSLLLLWTSG